jgi:hypothetical protein
MFSKTVLRDLAIYFSQYTTCPLFNLRCFNYVWCWYRNDKGETRISDFFNVFQSFGSTQKYSLISCQFSAWILQQSPIWHSKIPLYRRKTQIIKDGSAWHFLEIFVSCQIVLFRSTGNKITEITYVVVNAKMSLSVSSLSSS